MIDDMDLSVYAFRLYVRLKRVTGDSGKCFYSTRQLAEQCNMSVGAISKAKQELSEKELIRVERDGKWDRDNITIIDMWPANFAYFARETTDAACSPHEQEQEAVCSPHEQAEAPPVHHMNAPVHHMNTKEEPLKKELKKKGREIPIPPSDDEVNFWEDGPEQPIAPDPGEALHIAICEVLGWDFKTLPRKRRTELMHAAETLSRAGYSMEDVRRFMPAVWFMDWRWEIKHSRPNLDQFMEEIGKLRASTPDPVPRKTPAKLSESERAAIITRAKQAMNSLKTAQKFKGKIDPSWQLDIDRARELNLL